MSRQKIVLAKVGLDGHDVGILLVAKQLSQAGFEVVYLGKRNRPRDVVRVAIDEDAAAIGVSCLSGGLGYFATEVVNLLEEQGVDVPVLAGGIDEPEELLRMLDAGVQQHFGPGTSIREIVEAFKQSVTIAARERARAGRSGAVDAQEKGVP